MGSIQNESPVPHSVPGHIFLQSSVLGQFDSTLAATSHSSADAFLEHLLELYIKTERQIQSVKVRSDLAQRFMALQCRTQHQSSDGLMKKLLELHLMHQNNPPPSNTAASIPSQGRTEDARESFTPRPECQLGAPSQGRKSRKSKPKRNVRHTSLLDTDDDSVGPSTAAGGRNASSASWREMSVSSLEDTEVSNRDTSDMDTNFDLKKVKQEVEERGDDLVKAKQNDKAILIKKIFQKKAYGDHSNNDGPGYRSSGKAKTKSKSSGKLKKRRTKKAKFAVSASSDESLDTDFDLLEETRRACVVIGKAETGDGMLQANVDYDGDIVEEFATQEAKSPKHVYRYICYKCKKDLRSRAALNLHLMEEHGDNTEAGKLCTACGKHVTFEHELDLHKQFLCKHVKRSFACRVCKLGFQTAEDRDNHPCTKDAKKPYYCKYENCEFAGKHLNDLTEHVTRHLGLKPFLCTTCGRAFAAKKDMDRHMDIHKETKDYLCHECDKMYPSKNLLRRHMNTHTFKDRFKCLECSYTTSYKASFNTHMIKHKTRSHACHICDKHLRSEKSLQKHIHNRHTFKRIYTCRYCEFTVDDGPRYSNHMKKHRNAKKAAAHKKTDNTPEGYDYTLPGVTHGDHDNIPPSGTDIRMKTLSTAPSQSSATMTLTAAAIGYEEQNVADGMLSNIVVASVPTVSTEIVVNTTEVGLSSPLYNVDIPPGSGSLTPSSTSIHTIQSLMSDSGLMDTDQWNTHT